MKRVAANMVVIDCDTVEPNVMIERDDTGIVTGIAKLSDCMVEPSSTAFYNGIITSYVDLSLVRPGLSLSSLPFRCLTIGYAGKILLWQNISPFDLMITDKTTVSAI